MFGAVEIIETPLAVIDELDLSDVRSPSRALRRIKSGKRKHSIPKVSKPAALMIWGKMHVHPAIMAEIRRRTTGGDNV